jgi:hypothetical protein
MMFAHGDTTILLSTGGKEIPTESRISCREICEQTRKSRHIRMRKQQTYQLISRAFGCSPNRFLTGVSAVRGRER